MYSSTWADYSGLGTRRLDQVTLQSWNEGPAKQALLKFVERVTQPQSLQFAVDRVRQLSPQHPEWRTQQPFQGILAGDLGAVAAGGERGIVQLLMATHAGMTTDEFQ